MWAVVEAISNNKLYLVFDDQTRKIYINTQDIIIKENNYINIVNEKIVEVKEYKEDLYNKIKELEKKVLKKKK